MFVERWRKVVKNRTSLPTDLVNIIRNYTIVDPQQQLIDKYFGDNISLMVTSQRFGSNFQEKITITSHSSLKKLMVEDRFTRFQSKENKYTYSNCYECRKVDSYSTVKIKGSNNHYSYICHLCDKMDYCGEAKKDDDICNYNNSCSLCKNYICDHQFGRVCQKGIFCKDCVQLFHE
jgi:hypothetical protein